MQAVIKTLHMPETKSHVSRPKAEDLTFLLMGGKIGGPVVLFLVTLGLLCESPHCMESFPCLPALQDVCESLLALQTPSWMRIIIVKIEVQYLAIIAKRYRLGLSQKQDTKIC